MPEQGWMLAIDTSTEWAGIALTNGDQTAELNWVAGRQQTARVMPEVQRLLTTAGVTADLIGATTVATGPGSFSGLRVGMAIANGFTAATGIPTIGVSTLEVTVRPWLELGRPVIGVIRAGRARYGWAAGRDLDFPQSGAVAELIEFVRFHPEALVAGEIADHDAVRIRELTHAVVIPHPDRVRRAAVLARIGWDRWQSGDYDQDTVLEPTYLHRT